MEPMKLVKMSDFYREWVKSWYVGLEELDALEIEKNQKNIKHKKLKYRIIDDPNPLKTIRQKS